MFNLFEKKIVLLCLISIVLFAFGCGGGGGGVVTTAKTPYDFSKTESISVKELGEIDMKLVKSPDGLVNKNPELYPNVITDKDWNKNFNSLINDNTLKFTFTTSEVFTYKINEILVLSEDEMNGKYIYPFKKIINITTTEVSANVKTIDVPLEDIIKYGEINIELPITSTEFKLPDNKYSPSKAPIHSDASIGFNFEKDLVSEKNVSLIATGDIDIKMNLLMNIKFYDGFNYFYTALRTKNDSKYGLKVVSTGAIDKEITIGNLVNTKVKFLAVIPGIPVPIPVWIDVEIPFDVGMKGSFNATAEVTANFVDNARFGVIYTQTDDKWETITDYDKSFSVNEPTLIGNGNLKFYAGPKLKTNFYSKLGGPNLSLYASLYNEIDYNSTNYSVGGPYPLNFEWGVQAGILSDFDISLSLFDKDPLTWSANLSDSATSLSWDLAYGPRLKKLILSNSKIDIEKSKTFKLTDIAIKGLFENTEVTIPNIASNWSLMNGLGNYIPTTGIYTAPNSEGIANLKYIFEHKNKYWDKKDSAEIILNINIGEVSANTLTLVNTYDTTYKPEQIATDNLNNLIISYAGPDDIIPDKTVFKNITKYNTNFEKSFSININNYTKIAVSNDNQYIIASAVKSATDPTYGYLYHYQEITKYNINNGTKANSIILAYDEVDVDPGHVHEGWILPNPYDINLADRSKWSNIMDEIIEDKDDNIIFDIYNTSQTNANLLKIDYSGKTFEHDNIPQNSKGQICYANNVLYIATKEKISIYNTSFGKIKEISLPSTNVFTFDIKISSDGKKAYVLGYNSEKTSYNILLYDITSNSIVFNKTIEIPNAKDLVNPNGGIALTDDYMFILNTDAKKVYKYSIN
ncbi:MAG: hypothetical protein M0R46_08440 [Candidatus Muirbacterium halophilum]|nr:hypothetical protein [Candidatus Muirbacterium halophilum]MCK9475932.1 hypothetical protein [Candidatus Muirbacterium halophilum]